MMKSLDTQRDQLQRARDELQKGIDNFEAVWGYDRYLIVLNLVSITSASLHVCSVFFLWPGEQSEKVGATRRSSSEQVQSVLG